MELIAQLPDQAKSEHALLLMIIQHQPQLYNDSDSLMKISKIRNRNTFFKTLKDLENWGFITRIGRFGKYHIDTTKYHIDTTKIVVLNEMTESKYHIDTSTNSEKYHIDTTKKFVQQSKYHIDTIENQTKYHIDTTIHNVDNSKNGVTACNSDNSSLLLDSPHVHVRTPVRDVGAELANLLILEKEIKGGTGELREKTFLDSEIASYQDFKNAFNYPEFQKVDLNHYFQKMKNWRKGTATSANWIGTVKTFIRKDYTNNKLKTIHG